MSKKTRRPRRAHAALTEDADTTATATVTEPVTAGASDTFKLKASIETAIPAHVFGAKVDRPGRRKWRENYDRLAPKARNKKQLAGWLGVEPESLSRYERLRFGPAARRRKPR